MDVTAPSVPSGLAEASKAADRITLTWEASSDDVVVAGYEIFRDGTKVGTSTTPGYTDSGLKPSTTYGYTIKAYDAANNRSAASAELAVTTDAAPESNSVTIYYKQGYTSPNIHYRPTGGAWTTPPGVVMPAAEMPGYNKITIDVGMATGLEAVFNNGSGTWDNNGGKNYQFPLGVSTYSTGTILPGAPAGAQTTLEIEKRVELFPAYERRGPSQCITAKERVTFQYTHRLRSRPKPLFIFWDDRGFPVMSLNATVGYDK